MERRAADRYGVGFFYERHQLSDNLLEPREAREEEEKARDRQDNVHRIGTREREVVS